MVRGLVNAGEGGARMMQVLEALGAGVGAEISECA